MARYLFQLTSVTPAGSYVRLDSASGSTSPTAVSPVDSAYVFPGAILHSDATDGSLPKVAAGVATLYQKTLNASGGVTATATLTGTLVDGPGPGSLDPQTWPIPVNTDPAGLSASAAAIASNSAFTGTYATKANLTKSQFRLRPPAVLTSPPATTTGTASAASAITSSADVTAFEPGAYTFLGGPVDRGTGNPNGFAYTLGIYPQITSGAPTTAEFWLDTADSTGRFEVHWKGTATGVRVAVMQNDGSWGYVTAADTFTHTATGSLYRDLVTLGAAGRYKIRLEFGPFAVFVGVQVAPTDTVTATVRPKRYIVVGDSFSEPKIQDSGSWSYGDGWPVQLAYLTGLDVWCAGSGGTGYLQTNASPARPKFRDRLATDILAYNPDGIIWAGGLNDYANFSASAIGTEALLCYQQAKAALPNVDQVVLSPFWPQRLYTTAISNLLATSDAIAASAATAGATFLNLLELPNPDYTVGWAGTTLQASASGGATTISVGDIPAYFKRGSAQQYGWYIRIGGSATTAEVRYVNTYTGTGPYTLTLSQALTNAHSSGEAVAISGGAYMTGTGKQGTTASNGNADRYTGSDGTHPTAAGHLHIARTVAALWAAKLAA